MSYTVLLPPSLLLASFPHREQLFGHAGDERRGSNPERKARAGAEHHLPIPCVWVARGCAWWCSCVCVFDAGKGEGGQHRPTHTTSLRTSSADCRPPSADIPGIERDRCAPCLHALPRHLLRWVAKISLHQAVGATINSCGRPCVGEGLDLLKAFLNLLPAKPEWEAAAEKPAEFQVRPADRQP